MVIDSSALIALAKKESDYQDIFTAIDTASEPPLISSATVFEIFLVLSHQPE